MKARYTDMMRYSVSKARLVNTDTSKSGIKFQYDSRTDNPDEAHDQIKKRYLQAKENGDAHTVKFNLGVKIVDSVTKEVIVEELF